MKLSTIALFVLAVSTQGFVAAASDAGAAPSITVRLGPIQGWGDTEKVLTFQQDARRQARRFDIQDARQHNVRGVSLSALLAKAEAPVKVDAVIFTYTDGMEIPVELHDRAEVDAIFIALEHGDAMGRFGATYPLLNRAQVECPKVVYGRKVTAYSIWRYPTQLAAVRLVTLRLYEASLAHPARRHTSDRSGWTLYLRHCQSCHGIGGRGATRGPDFLRAMAPVYRRVPPLAITDASQHPRLHEKAKGYSDGSIPTLNHISNADITVLWRWLHTIHGAATETE